MTRRQGRLLLLIGGALLVLLVAGRVAVSFYTDALWYSGLGYLSTFWWRLGIGAGVRTTAAVVGAGLVLVNVWIVIKHLGPVRIRRRYGNIEIAEQIPRHYVLMAGLAISVLAGAWLSGIQFDAGSSLGVAAWLRSVDWGVADPLFGRDISFYVFALPVYFDVIDFLLLLIIWTVVLVALGHVLVGGIRWQENRLDVSRPARMHLVFLVAAMVLLLGVRYWLGRYGLLLEGNGVRNALGYTDVHARLPAYRAMVVLSAIAAGALLYGAWRWSPLPPVLGLGGLFLAALLLGQLYPAVVQNIRVEPNELAREAPYIAWNMEFTRRAYGLHQLDRRPFRYAPGASTGWEDVQDELRRLPLWDPEPLQTAYNQIQTLFNYYRFLDVDYDRYGPLGQERQVAIAVREFNLAGLSEGTQTWQSVRLNPAYVRGVGAVVSPAAETGAQGEPVLWMRNNPVDLHRNAPDGLELSQASVYFGENTNSYVILIPGRDNAFLGVPGRDYPDGVQLSSFFRVLAFAWRFGDRNLLFSGEITDESRFIFRRSLRSRVSELAPFLLWDPDPHPVIHEGRIVWMIDGYTASRSFPLSRAIDLGGAGGLRYLRNSVKATIDAVTGDVAFYDLTGTDPVLEAYRRIFPDLVQPLEAMPAGLRRHLRYPALALLTQTEILQEYHLEGPEAFYAGQDVWHRPQEQAPGGGLRDYPVTYALLPVPGGGDVRFLAMMPFIARGRQNMTAVLLAHSDPPNYGELMLLELPRDQQIPGPTQVQTIIEQDPIIAQQLSLWRQGGSDVDMGHLRVVPMDSSFLYVQPLFLSAEGSNPIPELRRVVVSDGRNVSMEVSLRAAVAALAAAEEGADDRPESTADGLPPVADWPRQALELLVEAEALLRGGDYAGYGERLRELRALLSRLSAGGS